MMHASQISPLDYFENQSTTTHPRIAELLAGKAMPAPTALPTATSTPAFTTELPAILATPPNTPTRTTELIPLPSPTTLREAVSSAMSELPVAMPAPVIKPVTKKTAPPQPTPLPKEAPTEAKPPVFDPPTTKREPIEAKPIEDKPIEDKPIEAKPIEAKPIEAKPIEAKPIEAKPIEAKPIEAKPIEAKPIEAKSIEAKSIEAKSIEAKPIEAKPIEAKPIEAKPIEAKPPIEAIEPSPASSPFVQDPTPAEKSKSTAPQTEQKRDPAASPRPQSVPQYQGTLPGFEHIAQTTTTDAQLVEALLPIVESSLEKALYAPKTGLHMYLEPMLRATVRRAIAEQMQTIHHFGQINVLDRIVWRFKALFTSRTYDDIVFERTHRYRVEEVYLLRYQSNSLISYASHDPSRHATPRKIKYDLSRMVEELKDKDGELRKSFELPNKNTAVVRCGQDCFLLASIRGPINALVRADLDYVLSQVEQRFGDRLRDQGEQFIHVLQPILEGCLLIQSPPPPR